MLKIKRNKKLMIPLLVMILVVAMAGVVFAQSSSYNMTIAGNQTKIYYGTHIYGSAGDTTYDIGSNSAAYFRSRAYCMTCDKGASDWAYIYSDEIDDTSSFDTDHSSNSHLIRCQIQNRYSDTDTVSGRYGLH